MLKLRTLRLLSAVFVCLFVCCGAADAARYWTGGSSAHWGDSANWDGGTVPAAGQSVVLSNSVAVVLTNSTPNLNSLTITNATLTFTNWTTVLTSATVTVQSDGVISCAGPFSDAFGYMSNRVYISCTDLTVAKGGRIDVSTRGFAEGNGPEPGIPTGSFPNGAGHGGRGGVSYTKAGRSGVYDSTTAPTIPGSGGGQYTAANHGSPGGGAIRVDAGGTVTVHGTIAADSAKCDYAASGGSGGAIYITCVTFGGSTNGLISAEGGDQNSDSTSWIAAGAGGGGGRIAVDYSGVAALHDVRFSTSGAEDSYVSNDWDDAWYLVPEWGTLWVPDTALLDSELTEWQFKNVRLHTGSATEWGVDSLVVSNCSLRFASPGFKLWVTNDLRVDANGKLQVGEVNGVTNGVELVVKNDLILTNGGALYVYAGSTNVSGASAGATVSVTNDFVVGPSSWLYPFSHATAGSSVRCIVDDLLVAAGGGIDAEGKGFAYGAGPGDGTDYTGAWCGGGGYGGRGGDGRQGSGGSYGGVSYGSTNWPCQPGSGGGIYSATLEYAKGGYGGGLIWIEATQSAIVDGELTADGENSEDIVHQSVRQDTGYAGGAGAGGGIVIQCETFGGAASGSLKANGGNANPRTVSPTPNGAGGGGRIAVDYTDLAAAHDVRFSVLPGEIDHTWDTPVSRKGPGVGTIHVASTNLLGTAGSQFDGTILAPGFSAWSVPSLTVSNTWLGFGDGFQLHVDGDLVVMGAEGMLAMPRHSELLCGGDVTVTNDGAVWVSAGPTNGVAGDYGALVSVTGAVNLYDGSWIYPSCDATNGGAPLVKCSTLLVAAADSGFNANAAGYDGSEGPGAGIDHGSGYAGGGAHGGDGGDGNNAAGGAAYGLTNAPVVPGSGGGHYSFAAMRPGLEGGDGGGVVWVQASGAAVVNGSLSADGQNPGGHAAGGGAGGAIFLTCSDFSGGSDALLSARGADAYKASGSNYGGGGGGGRIAVAVGLTDGDIGTLLAGGSVGNLSVFGDHAPFQGELQVTNGAGHFDYFSPGDTAEPGSAVFMTTAYTLTIDGKPAYYDSPTPHGYGTHSTIGTGSEVTNSITTPAVVDSGLRRTCFEWDLANDNGDPISDGVTTQVVFTFSTNMTLTWHWTNEYALTVTSAGNGSVNSGTVDGWYTNGFAVTNIEATPDPSYVFLKWTGDVDPAYEEDNPLVVTMDVARAVEATFSLNATLTNVWTGAGDWDDGGNWSQLSPPKPIDYAVIGSGTVTVQTAKDVLSLVVSNGAALMFTNWATTVSASNVVVQSNGLITAVGPFTDTEMSNRVHIVCTNLVVERWGRIDVAGKGFDWGDGPGNGEGEHEAYGGGAGHGGQGGNGGSTPFASSGSPGGFSYGSTNAPISPGSGGNSYQTNVVASRGGPGGGAIRIDALGTVTVNGTVSADGQDAGYISGGGSGGSIYITCDTFGGSADGILRVQGGVGVRHASVTHYAGGAGAGGRIAVDYASLSPERSTRFWAGAGSDGWKNDYAEDWHHAAENGTLWLPDPQLLSGTLTNWQFRGVRLQVPNVREWGIGSLSISNAALGFVDSGFRVFVTNDLRIEDGTLRIGQADGVTNAPWLEVGGSLTLTNGGALYLYASDTNDTSEAHGARLRVTNAVVIGPSSWIYPYAHSTDGSVPKLEMGSVAIAAGGGINAQGKGFAGHGGPGAGSPAAGGANGAWAGGAGYGGRGAQGTGRNAAGGATYGSSAAPVLPGSGGGTHTFVTADPQHRGGYGGGGVWIECGGGVLMDGTIRADGDPAGWASGGGSGGGVYIVCNAFGGSGAILADGGDGSASGASSGGAGGGGRIAVHYSSLSGTPSVRFSTDVGAVGDDLMASPAARRSAFVGTLYFSDAGLLGTLVSQLTGQIVVPGMSSWAPASLTVSNCYLAFPTGFALNVAGNIDVTGDGGLEMLDGGELACGGDLTLSDGGSLFVYAAATNGVDAYGGLVSVTGTLSIASGCTVYPVSAWTNGGAPYFLLGGLDLPAGGTILADGCGWASGQGIGAGVNSPVSAYPGGGGYGGLGGDGKNTAGGVEYGSSNAPALPGSGGGNFRPPYAGEQGGFGGGVVWMRVVGPASVKGAINVRGQKSGYAAGGGSGGAVFLSVEGPLTVAAGGAIRAGGGDGYDAASDGGGGAGGRIAVWHGLSEGDTALILNGGISEDRIIRSTSFGALLMTAAGGAGHNSPQDAEDGTVLVLTVNPPAGSLILIR